MILFFDTETTGFVDKNLPPDNPAQPHLVQLGFVLADDSGAEVVAGELIVAPEGYEIPAKASEVHGISTARALAAGIPLPVVVAVFTNLRPKAESLVAYNMDFDDVVMAAAIARTGRTPKHTGPFNLRCAMRECTPIVGLPPTEKMKAVGFDKNKPPNLTEAYRFFFNEPLPHAHSALADARACARIFFEMRRREQETQAI